MSIPSRMIFETKPSETFIQNMLIVTDTPIRRINTNHSESMTMRVDVVYAGDILEKDHFLRGRRYQVVMVPYSLQHDDRLAKELLDHIMLTIIEDPTNNKVIYY